MLWELGGQMGQRVQRTCLSPHRLVFSPLPSTCSHYLCPGMFTDS